MGPGSIGIARVCARAREIVCEWRVLAHGADMTTTQLRLGVRVLLCHVRRRHCLHHLITSPTLALSTPHSLTQHHSYTQPPTHEESCVVCWKCHRDLGEVSRGAKGREGRTEESGRWGVRFFCPCDEHVVLPPSKRHTYFEIMNWYEDFTVIHMTRGPTHSSQACEISK